MGEGGSHDSTKKRYYDRARKPKYKNTNNFPNVCALENDSEFIGKIEESNRAMKKLLFVSFICFLFMGLEFAGGILSGSLAILTDAAHMFSDVAGFMISFIAIQISKSESSTKYSYGYHRAEITGAFASIFLIWGLLVWLNIEATNRILGEPEKIDANVMLICAIIGFVCNVLNMCALNADCGQAEETEYLSSSSDENVSVSVKSKVSVISRSLHGSLMGVYKPR